MSRAKRKPKKRPKKQNKPQHRDVQLEELQAIIEQTASGPLSEENRDKLTAVAETLAFLMLELQAKGTSIRRLRNLLFGSGTEKTSAVVGPGSPGKQAGESKKEASEGPKEPRKGHGRNAASAYTGAEKVKISHSSLKGGDACPKCEEGKAMFSRAS